jgi:hypothetical protein
LTADLTRLRTVERRFSPEVAPFCAPNLAEQRAKVATQLAPDNARAAHDQ